ncbi:MAG: SEL1-like repeat protein, partial [Herminiimonas sp.]|nr:SEL1-like repeat protein [Herminiimonas sp.]
MATREQIGFIRNARAGKASAQLILGKYYLFGGAGLQKNVLTALYWLHRAALRDVEEAWLLIGEHVPFETATSAPDPMQLCVWYERAFDAGVARAGLVWVRLLLTRTGTLAEHAMRRKAFAALETAAASGLVEAQWLLAQELRNASHAAPRRETESATAATAAASAKPIEKGALEWATRAAANGVLQAQRALAERAWSMRDMPAFLNWSASVARAVVDGSSSAGSSAPLSEKDAALLSRYARALYETDECDMDEVERCWEMAAQASDREAQFALGLWYANMDESGARLSRPARKSNYRNAIHWLTMAGEQGVAKAWYALFRIYVRPNTGLTQHSAAEVQRCLERAAEQGHVAAQLELGKSCWRTRRSKESNDVRAAYWLQKAAAQGDGEARMLLRTIATCATPAQWAQAAHKQFTHDMVNSHPLLAARVELAGLFGLSLPEALLLDLNAADWGHCLLIDIRSLNAHRKRRLILIQTGEERLALTRIARHFANIDCGVGGPEGNYRQR